MNQIVESLGRQRLQLLLKFDVWLLVATSTVHLLAQHTLCTLVTCVRDCIATFRMAVLKRVENGKLKCNWQGPAVRLLSTCQARNHLLDAKQPIE